MRMLFSLLVLFVLSACSTEENFEIPEEVAVLENVHIIPPGSEPSGSIKVEKVVVVGEMDDQVIGRISGITVDENRRIYLADDDNKTIHVFDEQGKRITSIGRDGRGPGEFGQIMHLRNDNRHLYASDLSQMRIHIFSIPGWQHVKTINLFDERPDIAELRRTQPGNYFLRNDGTFLVAFAENINPMAINDPLFQFYYMVNTDGKIISDRIVRQKTVEFIGGIGSGLFPSPFSTRTLVAVSTNGSVYTAESDRFFIKIHDEEGNYEKAIYYPYSNAALNLEKLLQNYSDPGRRQMIRNTDVPNTWPALDRLMADDRGRIWAAAITDHPDVHEWWVLSPKGDFLSRFTWPREKAIQKIKGDYLYTLETNAETGEEFIVKYEISFF